MTGWLILAGIVGALALVGLVLYGILNASSRSARDEERRRDEDRWER